MPQCRQKGYASRLLEEVRKIGAETGATKIHLNVEDFDCGCFGTELGGLRIRQRARQLANVWRD